MNIWTEQLLRQHLPMLEHWLNRTGGKLTSNDLPEKLRCSQNGLGRERRMIT